MIDTSSPSLSPSYRYIFIVDSLAQWELVSNKYEIKKDLVLTFDLDLKKELSSLNNEVYFIDHLVSQVRMQKNNFLIYDFFKNWNKNKFGEDLFVFKNVPFGRSFKLDFWNDYVNYIRIYLSLKQLTFINYKVLYVVSKNNTVSTVLKDLQLSFFNVDSDSSNGAGFYFPISEYMDSKLRPSGFRRLLYKARRLITNTYGYFMQIVDKIPFKKNKKIIFIQEYHPTRALLGKLRDEGVLRVLLSNFSRNTKIINNLKERLLPVNGSKSEYEEIGGKLFFIYTKERVNRLVLDDGTDITEFINTIIESRILKSLPNKIITLNSIINYLDRNKVSLCVLIANIGHEATLFDCVCQTRNIPSYLIINGMLGPVYSDESKYATVINSYSTSIRDNYFIGMHNIVTLGDPRMDLYPVLSEYRKINRQKPTVLIGTSGFNSTDLNSYVAVEFDFMFDVLTVLQEIKSQGVDLTVIIKVRPNGYEKQYKNFANKFFPSLNSQIVSAVPMSQVFKKSDLYISIYSQTLFEASCLGIPVIFYKKDNETLMPPFDQNCELVTATSPEQLMGFFNDFKNNGSCYTDFLKREVMEKYIGPLDGNNLARNMDFIVNYLQSEGDLSD